CPHVAKSFHYSACAIHLHHSHNSRCHNAPKENENKKYRAKKRTHCAHQFPIARAKRAEQNQRKQEKQCQDSTSESELQTVPTVQYGMQCYSRNEAWHCQPIRDAS